MLAVNLDNVSINADDTHPDDNPLMNKKLQNLNDRPKDFVLIFKNKSCREYSPKKKIRYSSLLKDLRNAKKSLSPDYDQNVDNNRTDNQF